MSLIVCLLLSAFGLTSSSGLRHDAAAAERPR